jgi:hypothetical protein
MQTNHPSEEGIVASYQLAFPTPTVQQRNALPYMDMSSETAQSMGLSAASVPRGASGIPLLRRFQIFRLLHAGVAPQAVTVVTAAAAKRIGRR